MFVIARVAADLDHLPVVHAGGMHAAVESLDPFGVGRGHLQPHGDVAGDVIAAHAHAIGKDHVFLDEDRHPGGAAAQIDTGRPQFLFVFDQRRDAGGIGRRGDAGEFEIAALDTMGKVLHRCGIHRQHVHVDGKPVADLAPRIDKAGAVIEREVDGLGMHDLTAFAVFGHIAAGQNAGHVLLCDHLPVEFKLRVQAVAARCAAGETGDDVIDADPRHLLGCLQRGAYRALGLSHGADLAEAHTARPGRGGTDHTETGLPGQ